jgi:hypothetical protein
VLATEQDTRESEYHGSEGVGASIGIPIAFAPFIVFVIPNRTIGTLPCLTLAAITSVILVTQDAMNKGGRGTDVVCLSL